MRVVYLPPEGQTVEEEDESAANQSSFLNGTESVSISFELHCTLWYGIDSSNSDMTPSANPPQRMGMLIPYRISIKNPSKRAISPHLKKKLNPQMSSLLHPRMCPRHTRSLQSTTTLTYLLHHPLRHLRLPRSPFLFPSQLPLSRK